MPDIICYDGSKVLVDDEDWIHLIQWEWGVSNGYVKRGENYLTLYMHIIIWNQHFGEIPKGKEIDHINRNKLDNRKCNLRLATSSQNKANFNIAKNNTSGARGVYYSQKWNKWVAQIKVNSKCIYLGSSYNIKEAANIYNKASKHYFGEFGFQNNLEDL